MKFDLPELLADAEGIIDLEERLKSHDIQFSTIKEYGDFVQREWSQIVESYAVEVLEFAELDSRPLVVEEMTRSGFLVQIHGINHGAEIYTHPGFQLRRQMRQELHDYFQSLLTEQDSKIRFEENLAKLLYFPDRFDIKDHTTGKTTMTELQIWGALAGGLTALIISPMYYGSLYLAHAWAGTWMNPGKHFSFKQTQEALHSMAGQAKQSKAYFVQELPQPFALEFRYLQQKSSLGYAIKRLIFPNTATVPERSFWTARQLEQLADGPIHYVCGFAHVSQIAYFLQNPEYSFIPLETYRKTQRIS